MNINNRIILLYTCILLLNINLIYCNNFMTCEHTEDGNTLRMDCSCAKTNDEYLSCCLFDEYMNCLITNNNGQSRYNCVTGNGNFGSLRNESLIDNNININIMAPFDLVPVAGYNENDFTNPPLFNLLINSNDIFLNNNINDNSFNGIGTIENVNNERTYATRLVKPELSYYRIVPKSTRVVACNNNDIFIKNEEEATVKQTGKSWKTQKLLIFSINPITLTIYQIQTWQDSALIASAFCKNDLFDVCLQHDDSGESSESSESDEDSSENT